MKSPSALRRALISVIYGVVMEWELVFNLHSLRCREPHLVCFYFLRQSYTSSLRQDVKFAFPGAENTAV